MSKNPSVPASPDREAETFRRFNRMYTRFIGTLNEGLLDTSFTLAEARVLYELATRKQPGATEIAEALGLDAGYLSRLLAKLEKDGLLERRPSQQDARAAVISLTRRGKSIFHKLNTRSQEQALTILQNLPTASRLELLSSMQTVERILAPPEQPQPTFLLRPHRVGDMGWVVHSESVGYAQQFGWNAALEALVAEIVSEFLTHFDPARERCWIAEIDGRSVGHIFLVRHPAEPQTARLRLLFVEPAARGLGLGETLVRECIRFAQTASYTKITLWTQSILTAAHRIYAKAGFRLVRETPHESFGHHLVGQEWELDLPSSSYSLNTQQPPAETPSPLWTGPSRPVH